MQYILKSHAPPSTLIICSTKDAFLRQTKVALQGDADQDHENRTAIPQHTWTTPTLRLLASSRTVKVAFCPELPHLRAQPDSIRIPRINGPRYSNATVHPTALNSHPSKNPKPNPASSAHFSILGSRSEPHPCYCCRRCVSYCEVDSSLAECPSSQQTVPDEDTAIDLGSDDALAALPATSNPWDDEVSILNVTTKSFGAGERGWVGRTVKVRTIAERWCVSQDMSAAGD